MERHRVREKDRDGQSQTQWHTHIHSHRHTHTHTHTHIPKQACIHQNGRTSWLPERLYEGMKWLVIKVPSDHFLTQRHSQNNGPLSHNVQDWQLCVKSIKTAFSSYRDFVLPLGLDFRGRLLGACVVFPTGFLPVYDHVSEYVCWVGNAWDCPSLSVFVPCLP